MLSRTRRSVADQDQGFTLIELLVVIIIIGILAAIAIPVFLNQRKKAVDASLKTDMHTAAVLVETWTIDNVGVALTYDHSGTATGALKGIKASPGNYVYVVPSATVGAWCLFAWNAKASQATGWPDMAWRSLLGGMDPVLAPNAACV